MDDDWRNSDEFAEVVAEFLAESRENLDRLDQELVQLEQDPHSTVLLASIFRTIHTVKGTSGFLGYGALERIAHAGENLLAKLRDGALELDASRTDGLLATVDAVRTILDAIEATGEEGEDRWAGLVVRLEELTQPGTATPDAVAAGDDAAAPASDLQANEVVVPELLTPEVVTGALPSPDEAPEPAEPARGKPVAAPGPADVVEAPRRPAVTDASPATTTPAEPPARQAPTLPVPARAAEAPARRATESTVRIDLSVLDDLFDLVGELVLARNELLVLAGERTDDDLGRSAGRIGALTSDLQDRVLRTRMAPVGSVWSAFPRVVRDLANSCGKRVRLVTEGASTELDRTLVEAIRDPLTHLLRNAVDHGVEDPERRAAAGKPAEGTITLSAFHEGGQVVIEMSDDGGGIDARRVRDKAVAKGLLTEEAAEALTEREALELIFLPGFSTAEKVSNVSGRGVGMDVVRTNIASVGGSLDVHTCLGEGTRFRLRVPLTVAILPALIVRIGDERLAIPQAHLQELVRLSGNRRVEWVHDTPVLRRRGTLLPVVDLGALLGIPGGRPLPPPDEPPPDGPVRRRKVPTVVVARAGERVFGLLVDRAERVEEVVVKPLGRHVHGIAGLAGCTILGDGRVVVICDLAGLADRAGLVAGAGVPAETGAESTVDSDLTPLVVCDAGGERIGMPLRDVERFEKVPAAHAESVGGEYLLRYRGGILPLVVATALLGLPPSEPADHRLRMLVCRTPRGPVGLVVDRIRDVVPADASGLRPSPLPAVAGTLVLGDRLTSVLDPEGLGEKPRRNRSRSTRTTRKAAAG